MGGTSATHVVAPFVERNGFCFVIKFDVFFLSLNSTSVFYDIKINFQTIVYQKKHSNTVSISCASLYQLPFIVDYGLQYPSE